MVLCVVWWRCCPKQKSNSGVKFNMAAAASSTIFAIFAHLCKKMFFIVL
jgi:hypothetical protein